LRKRQTDAERQLWQHLRSKQIEGFKFRRQEPIGEYIVDFVCFDSKVVIEVDGGQHAEEGADKERDRWLNKEGFKVLRFWNNEVLLNLRGVLEIIKKNCLKSPSPFASANPPRRIIPSHQGRGNRGRFYTKA
jgi:very-short-patch-repair endonuclease